MDLASMGASPCIKSSHKNEYISIEEALSFNCGINTKKPRLLIEYAVFKRLTKD